jgi:hypothetical protein
MLIECRNRSHELLLLPMLIVLLLMTGVGRAEERPLAGALDGSTLRLVLEDGLFQGASPTNGCVPLLLEMNTRDGTWDQVWGIALSFNNGDHSGHVLDASVSDTEIKLSVALRIASDPWVNGGWARFQINLKRDGSQLAGTYSGSFREVPHAGTVVGIVERPRKPFDGYVPLRQGEHPRMLIRAHQIPTLREKLKTPFGQSALAKMRESIDPIAMGLLYQLTGEKAYADKALALTRKEQADLSPGPWNSGQAWGPRMTRIGTTYDLCFGAWPEDYHKELDTYLDGQLRRLFWDLLSITSKANWNPCSNYTGPMRGGGAIGSLVLWGEKGPKPVPPAAPAGNCEWPAPVGFKPGKGVPVSDYQDGEMPEEWIYAGGFLPLDGEDPLASVGGLTKACPEVGMRVTYRGVSETFAPLSHEKDKGFWQVGDMMRGKKMIDITNSIGRRYNTTSYYYTVIRNDTPRWVRVSTGYSLARVCLAGLVLKQGECVKLSKGLYPILVEAPIGMVVPWGRHLMQPRLVELPESEVKAIYDRFQYEYEQEIDYWKHEMVRWDLYGGLDLRKEDLFRAGHRQMWRHYRQGMGDGGFQAETGGYSTIAMREPSYYAMCYRNMFGVPPTVHADVELLPIRKMMAMVFASDGGIKVQDINGDPNLSVDYVAMLYPVVPARYQPALLWYWQRLAGAETDATKVLDTLTPVSFVNYPVDPKTGALGVPCSPPAEVLPLTWAAPTFGYFCMRNGWKGNDDVVVQVFAKTHPIGGWSHPNAGTVRMLGLGYEWLSGPSARGADRWQEPLVDLPDDEFNQYACGIVTASAFNETTGAGRIAIDLGDVYSAPGGRLYDQNGRRNAREFKPSGITGSREVVVSFEKPGCVAELTLLDTIKGGGTKIWKWQLPEDVTPDMVTMDGNQFTITRQSAVLTVTLTEPKGVTLELASGKRDYIIKGGSKRGQKTTQNVHAIHGSSADDPAHDTFKAVARLSRR